MSEAICEICDLPVDETSGSDFHEACADAFVEAHRERTGPHSPYQICMWKLGDPTPCNGSRWRYVEARNG